MRKPHEEAHDVHAADAHGVREADARLVERITRAFAPAPLDDAGRARFDARLRERIVRSGAGGRRLWLPSLAGAVAALALFVLARGSVGPGEPPEPAESAALSAWEWDVLLGSELEGGEGGDEGLPADYAAIATAFLSP